MRATMGDYGRARVTAGNSGRVWERVNKSPIIESVSVCPVLIRIPVVMFPISWREKHARGTLGALVSCIVHTTLLICLALIYFTADEAQPPAMILQGALAGAEEVALEYADQANLEAPKGDDLSHHLHRPAPSLI